MNAKNKMLMGRIASLTLIMLMIGMSLPMVAAKPGGGSVVIDSIEHDASGTLHENDVLTVTMVGTADCSANFDVGSAASRVSMTETSPGNYVGTYTIESGDDGTHVVTGHPDLLTFGHVLAGQLQP